MCSEVSKCSLKLTYMYKDKFTLWISVFIVVLGMLYVRLRFLRRLHISQLQTTKTKLETEEVALFHCD